MRRRRGSERSRFSLRPEQRRIVLWVVGVGVGAFLAGYLLTTVLFFPGWGRDTVVAVPDLRERPLAEARRLAGRADLEVEQGSTLAHPTLPAGAVLAQTPLPGQEVARGSVVRVILSAGPERRPVPGVEQLTGEQATALLQGTGFAVRVLRVPSQRPEGTVLGVSPAPGTLVPIPGVVELTLSAGPPQVAVPAVVGLPEPAARDALQAAGLRLGEVEYDPFADVPLGEVAAQSPAAGTQVRSGSAVRVRISGNPPAGAEPAEPAEPDTIGAEQSSVREGG